MISMISFNSAFLGAFDISLGGRLVSGICNLAPK